jgi:probable phosphoglycerate mutase
MLDSYVCEPLEELLKNVCDVPVREELLISRAKLAAFKNAYIGFRHGQSNANIAGIISSDFEIGVNGPHGLTPTGETQARDSLEELFKTVGGREKFENGEVVFVSSPFSRARQTAEVAAAEVEKAVGKKVVVEICEGLRERYFGEYDQLALIYYNKVWPIDQKDSENSRYGVESVADVCKRVLNVIEDCEKKHQDKILIMTSHADTLQVLNTLFSAEDPRMFAAHRFKNCEVRELNTPGLETRRVPLSYQ